jgi:hypothetical protein
MGTDCRRLTRQYTGLRHDILCSIKKKGGRTEPVQPLFDVLRQALVSRPTHTAISPTLYLVLEGTRLTHSS